MTTRSAVTVLLLLDAITSHTLDDCLPNPLYKLLNPPSNHHYSLVD